MGCVCERSGSGARRPRTPHAPGAYVVEENERRGASVGQASGSRLPSRAVQVGTVYVRRVRRAIQPDGLRTTSLREGCVRRGGTAAGRAGAITTTLDSGKLVGGREGSTRVGADGRISGSG